MNLASRLQGLGDNNQILVSADTFALVARRVKGQRMGERTVRGREEPVVTYLVERLE